MYATSGVGTGVGAAGGMGVGAGVGTAFVASARFRVAYVTWPRAAAYAKYSVAAPAPGLGAVHVEVLTFSGHDTPLQVPLSAIRIFWPPVAGAPLPVIVYVLPGT